MADSGGKLWLLKPQEKNQTQIADGLVISSKWATDAEFESCAKNMCEYFKNGYFGLADEFSFGFVADYYNRMYMRGISKITFLKQAIKSDAFALPIAIKVC